MQRFDLPNGQVSANGRLYQRLIIFLPSLKMCQTYAELEKVRLENGYGMSQKMLDLVIAQCETFAADTARPPIRSSPDSPAHPNRAARKEPSENRSPAGSQTGHSYKK